VFFFFFFTQIAFIDVLCEKVKLMPLLDWFQEFSLYVSFGVILNLLL